MAEQGHEGDEKQAGANRPGVYFNGFNINNTLVDFQLEINLNGNVLETYNIAPITAKNLALQLLGVVDKYEQLTGTHIEPFKELKERTQERMKENEQLKKEQEKKDKEQKEKEEKEKGQNDQKPRNE